MLYNMRVILILFLTVLAVTHSKDNVKRHKRNSWYMATNSMPTCLVQNCTESDNGTNKILLKCEGFLDACLLMRMVHHKSESKPICRLTILNSRIPFFPKGSFRGLNINTILIGDSDIGYFTPPHDIRCRDFNSGIHYNHYPRPPPPSAFEGLEETLEGFYLINNNGPHILNWNEFRNMKNLTYVKLRNNRIPQIINLNEAFKNNTKLEDFYISETYLPSLGYSAFSNNSNLTDLTVRSTGLRIIIRKDLPIPGTKLKVIDLSDNNLRYLPPDIFADMPNLEHLSLSNNQLTTLQEKTFKPVLNSLNVLHISGNPMECDNRLNWLKKLYKPSNSSIESKKNAFTEAANQVTCVYPWRLAGRRLSSLTDSDLVC